MSRERRPLVEKKVIRLGIIGCTPGNGHPYSWSAMFNGYDKEKMTRECPYPGIPQYLNKQPVDTLRIPDAEVTHIFCTGNGDFTAEHAAECSLIPKVVSSPEAMIDKVDAVVIATDIGSEHVKRAEPFVQAGIPLFIDKPMVDSVNDLRIFNRWIEEDKPILSTSSMRYVKEFIPYHYSTANLGELRFISITTPKMWETYGIHALEAIYPITGPGFVSARNTGTKDRNIVHFKHKKGIDVVVTASSDMYGGFGLLTLCGTHGSDQLRMMDSFYAFKTQLEMFINYLRTGVRPFPYSETEELMRMLIAGIKSREEYGKEIILSDIF